MTDQLISDKLKEAIHIAQSIAKEYSHKQYSSAHLLKALLHKDVGMLKYLESIGQDGYYVEEWAEVRLESLPKTSKPSDNISGDDAVTAIFYEAESVKLKIKTETLNEFCVLIAICTPGVGFSYEQLKTLTLTPNELLSHFANSGNVDNLIADQIDTTQKANSVSDNSVLNTYCVDKTFWF